MGCTVQPRRLPTSGNSLTLGLLPNVGKSLTLGALFIGLVQNPRMPPELSPMFSGTGHRGFHRGFSGVFDGVFSAGLLAVFIAVFPGLAPFVRIVEKPPSPFFYGYGKTPGVICDLFCELCGCACNARPRSGRNRQRSVSPRPYPLQGLTRFSTRFSGLAPFCQKSGKTPAFFGSHRMRPPGPVARL